MVSAVIHLVTEMPILVISYSLGYATGNVVGTLVEKKLVYGMIILEVFSSTEGQRVAETFRKLGQPVTIFSGEGRAGTGVLTGVQKT